MRRARRKSRIGSRISVLSRSRPSLSGAQRARRGKSGFALFSRPRAEDLTIFTGDLALLLRTGARINDALELLATDADVGRMRRQSAAITGSILSGESFGEALAGHPDVFPPIYVALARVGEASGTLVSILEALSFGASAQRGPSPSAQRRAPISRISAVRGGRRADLLSRLCAAAIRQRIPRLQRQAGPGARHIPRPFGLYACERSGARSSVLVLRRGDLAVVAPSRGYGVAFVQFLSRLSDHSARDGISSRRPLLPQSRPAALERASR